MSTGDARYRAIFQGAPDAMILLEPGTARVLETNAAAVRLWGEDGTRGLWDRCGTDVSGRLRAYCQRAPSEGAPFREEARVRVADGSELSVELAASWIEDAHGMAVLLTCRPAAPRSSERFLRHQQALLELLRTADADLDTAIRRITEVDARTLGVERVSVWFFNADHTELRCHSAYHQSKGKHMAGPTLTAADYPRYFQSLQHTRILAARDARTDVRTSEFTSGYLEPEGITSMMDVAVWLQGRVVGVVCHEHMGPMREWQKEEEAFASAIADMLAVQLEAQEKRQAQETTQDLQNRFRVIFEESLDAIGVSVAGIHVVVNAAYLKMFGYDFASELVGVPIVQLIAPSEREFIQERARLRAEGKPVPGVYETRGLRKDGTEFDMEVHASTYPSGGRNYTLVILRDITDRKRFEQELALSVSLLRATLEATWDGVLVVDNSGRIATFNRNFAHMWRIPEHVLATNFDQHVLRYVVDQLKDPEAFLTRVQELYAHPDLNSFDVLEFKDGRVFERYSRAQVVEGRSVGRVWSFRDVTERARLEEQFRQAQKMEAIGRLAGGIAHDFNNLLTTVMGYGQTLLDELPSDNPLRGNAEQVLHAAQRAADLTYQLLAFSRRQVLQPRVLDLNTVVSDLGKLLKRVIGEDVHMTTRLASDLGFVRADPGQIAQVIMNLAVNARDAMPRGGRLTVETQNLERVEGVEIAGPLVMLAVTDDGVGMDETTLSRIFEPFFTTKEMGKGTGLGLSTVYGIVKQSGGHIGVSSRPNEGASFRIYLPRVAAEAADGPTELQLTRESGHGQATVLLVEDEDAVRLLIRHVLESRGYRVLVTRDADEALKVSSRHDGNIDLLLTDVLLPQMDGHELAKRLGEDRPAMKVLFVSGYPSDFMGDGQGLPPGTNFLQKPFTPLVLARAVQDVLRRP
ncbi:MAG: PAS domain S-box protein [Myxococcota bacterium]